MTSIETFSLAVIGIFILMRFFSDSPGSRRSMTIGSNNCGVNTLSDTGNNVVSNAPTHVTIVFTGYSGKYGSAEPNADTFNAFSTSAFNNSKPSSILTSNRCKTNNSDTLHSLPSSYACCILSVNTCTSAFKSSICAFNLSASSCVAIAPTLSAASKLIFKSSNFALISAAFVVISAIVSFEALSQFVNKSLMLDVNSSNLVSIVSRSAMTLVTSSGVMPTSMRMLLMFVMPSFVNLTSACTIGCDSNSSDRESTSSSIIGSISTVTGGGVLSSDVPRPLPPPPSPPPAPLPVSRSEEHTSELQSQFHLVCRLPSSKENQA